MKAPLQPASVNACSGEALHHNAFSAWSGLDAVTLAWAAWATGVARGRARVRTPAGRRRPRCGVPTYATRSVGAWRAGVWRRHRARAGRAAAAVEGLPGLAVAHAAQRRQRGMQVAARAQGMHLVEQARLQHVLEALGDALVQPAAIGRLQRDQRQRQARVWPPALQARQRLAGDRQTSSARWMRCASCGARRAAVAGSTRASSRMQRGPAHGRSTGVDALRVPPASASGRVSRPSSSAFRYSIVPPTSSGSGRVR